MITDPSYWIQEYCANFFTKYNKFCEVWQDADFIPKTESRRDRPLQAPIQPPAPLVTQSPSQ